MRSFKLDLDSPGDTPHRISPLGQTWTRRSLLTVGGLDRQKMGEPPPPTGSSPPPVNLSQLTKY